MRVNAVVLAVIFAAGAGSVCAAAQSEDYSNLVTSAESVEHASRSGLGIGIRELSLLFDADPHGFWPKFSLVKEGKWALLQDLEAKGYIKTSISDHLPDGTQQGEFVTYVATRKGKAIADAFLRPQDSPSVLSP